MWGTYGDTNQDTIQLWFLLAAVLCIPWMLLPKPLILMNCKRKQDRIKDEEDLEGGNQTGRLLSADNLSSGECMCCFMQVVAKKGPEEGHS